MATGILGAVSDLGMGNMLAQQRDDETEDEKRKRRFGLSQMGDTGMDFGRTGIASIDLGMPRVGRR